jgi:hypothetical protein
MIYYPAEGIYFDGPMCAGIAQAFGGLAVFFILCHEMAHHALEHVHSADRHGELMADRLATMLILMQYPQLRCTNPGSHL